MGKKTELVNLPTRLLALELGGKKRWTRIIFLGALGVGAIAGAVYGVVRMADTREAASLEAAWSDLNGCLIGSPEADKDAAKSKVSLVQLAVLGMPKDKRGAPGEAPWPQSCAPAAFSLHEHAGAAGDKAASLGEDAEKLAKALKEDVGATSDLGPLIDKVWGDAAAAKLATSTPAKGPSAPKAASVVFTPDAFAALPKFVTGNFALSNIREAPSLDTSKLRFLVDQKEAGGDAPVVCTSAEADATVRCVKVPPAAAKLAPGIRLFGTTDSKALPFYFVGEHGQLGIFPPTGKDPVASVAALGASARADGALFLLERGDAAKDLRLFVAPATGPTHDTPVAASTEYDNERLAGLLWDWLVYRGAAKTGNAHLMAKKLSADGVEAGAAIDIGELELQPPDKAVKDVMITGCKTDDGVIVRVPSAPADTIAIYAAGRWAVPLKTGTRAGALTCRGVEAVTTDVTHSVEQEKDFPVITQSHCSTSGCTTAQTNLREIFGSIAEIAPTDSNSIVAADIGGKLVVVWNGGPGGLRMRIADIGKLKEAEDVVIADARDPSNPGKRSMVTELKLVSAGKYGLLFIGLPSGVRAIRIDPTGAVKPAPGAI